MWSVPTDQFFKQDQLDLLMYVMYIRMNYCPFLSP